MPTSVFVLDVRTIPPPQRHPRIFEALDKLAPGQELLLMNDHEPKPLRYQIQATQPESFDWDPRQTGIHEWTVRIRRLQASPPLAEMRLPTRLPHFSETLAVGKLVGRSTAAREVLARFGLTPGVEDPRPLRDLAAEANIDIDILMAALETSLAR
ncbi:MAG: DUF2249 domain-containing protein [Chloroflexota bacterium]